MTCNQWTAPKILYFGGNNIVFYIYVLFKLLSTCVNINFAFRPSVRRFLIHGSASLSFSISLETGYRSLVETVSDIKICLSLLLVVESDISKII